MEWAQGGSLAHVLKLAKTAQCPSFWNATGKGIIVTGLVLGMRYMHSRNYIHQDLKPSNILLSAEGRVLIGDFGASRNPSAEATPKAAGTVRYAAPELGREDVDWTEKVDVYSFGLIVYEILVGFPVFPEDERPFQIFRRQRSGYVPEISPSVFPPMKSLITSCLQSNPTDRPSFDSILKTFEDCEFFILPESDPNIVRDYVDGIRDWELEHPSNPVIGGGVLGQLI